MVKRGWEKFKICFHRFSLKIKSWEKACFFLYSETGCCHFQGNSASIVYQCCFQPRLKLLWKPVLLIMLGGGFYFIMSHVFIPLSPCLPLTLCLYPPQTTSPKESRTSWGNRLSVHGCNVTVTPPLTIPANFLLLIWQSHRRFGIRSWGSDLRCWVYSNISCCCS